jgi:hypothetical protein
LAGVAMSLFLLKKCSLLRLSREAESSHFAGERGEIHPIAVTTCTKAPAGRNWRTGSNGLDNETGKLI